MVTILVVVDSPVDRHRVAGLLEKQPGWKAVYAGDGQEALEAVKGQPPDLVLTDLRMPGLNGLELVEALRVRAPSLPVILMTAYGNEDVAALALQRGAANYVAKRNLSRQLFSTVANVLEITQANRGHQRVMDSLQRAETTYLLDNDPSLIPHVIGHLRDNLLALRLCGENEALRVGMALREALTNAIVHGNLELGPEPVGEGEEAYARLVAERAQQAPYRDRHVELTVKESRTEVVYVVRDEGPGFNHALLSGPRDATALEKVGERGLMLIHTFMDEVRHNTPGNEITLVKRRR
jgi:CheY-like chemotaxis protein